MKAFKSIRIFLIFLIILTLFLTGCNGKRVYEKSGLILQMAVEKGSNNNLMFTMTMPVIHEKSENRIDIITSEQNLISEARDNARNVSGKMVEGGKLQIIYFSDELAKDGIHPLLEMFDRNLELPLLAYVVVIDGSPNKLINQASKFENKPRVALHITELLETAMNTSHTPETNISRFEIDYYAHGIDPITPMIKLNKEEVEIMGCALFSGDKMVGKLDTKDTVLLQALRNKKNFFSYFFDKESEFTSGFKKGVSIVLKQRHRKVDINTSNMYPHITIDLSFTGEIDEYGGHNKLDNNKLLKDVETKIENAIKDNCTRIFKHMQQIGSDPIGIGNIIRAKHSGYWKSITWKDIYINADIDINIDLNIQKYGALK